VRVAACVCVFNCTHIIPHLRPRCHVSGSDKRHFTAIRQFASYLLLFVFFFIPNHNGILCNRHFPDLYLNSEYHFYYITAVVYVQIFLLSSV